jgi:transcription initiation factor TFIID subunit TAF12
MSSVLTELLSRKQEQLMMEVADDFLDELMGNAVVLAQRRQANVTAAAAPGDADFGDDDAGAATIDANDVYVCLEKGWNIHVPRVVDAEAPRAATLVRPSERHRKRLALARRKAPPPSDDVDGGRRRKRRK